MTGVPGLPAYGVYGLALEGLPVSSAGRPAPAADWERWSVRQSEGSQPHGEGLTVEGSKARIDLPGTGVIEIDRDGRTINFRILSPVSPEALLHPGLVPVAAAISWWSGRIPMHAAAVVVDGRVWGLLADREGGKSTTASMLWRAGYELFCDDMLVVEGRRCFAGPPSVDLREAAADRFGGEALGMVGGRYRHRLRTEVRSLERALEGWIDLRWSDGPPSVGDVPAGERVGALARHVTLPIAGEELLELADARMICYARPRDLARAEEHLGVLIDELHRR